MAWGVQIAAHTPDLHRSIIPRTRVLLRSKSGGENFSSIAPGMVTAYIALGPCELLQTRRLFDTTNDYWVIARLKPTAFCVTTAPSSGFHDGDRPEESPAVETHETQ